MAQVRWVLIVSGLALAARGNAQSVTAGVSRPSSQPSVGLGLQVPDTSKGRNFGLRFITGLGGAAVGLFAGAFAGPAVFGTDCGGCDDPGLGQALLGALIGTISGAAFAAALPQAGSHCGFGGRFGHALIGSTIGGGVGALVSGGTAVILFSIPIGAAGGGAVSAQAC